MNPAMLLIDATPFEVVQIVITSLIGLFGIAAALNGHLYRKINPLFRLGLVVGGLSMMFPGTLTDVVGLVVVGGIILYQYMSAKKPQLA
jgi:TRAP-type uncharacterized transport system fused permease subunit